LQTLADPHARSIQKLGEQTMLPFQKTEDANPGVRHFTPIFAPFPKVPSAPARV
jgi:hypothetical protein